VPTAKIIARYDRTLQLLPRAVELANVAYIFDNTQTAELILQAIDGALNMLKPTVPNWVERGLISPYAQRSVARQAIEMFVSDRKLELEFASLLEASYVGEVVMLDGCYGVQLVGGRAIVHDLSVVKLPQPSASVIEVSYDRGVATIRS
jgi:hypothetical protein